MADTEVNGAESRLPSEQVFDLEEEERKEDEEKKKAREPPIVYKDLLDVSVCVLCSNIYLLTGFFFIG